MGNMNYKDIHGQALAEPAHPHCIGYAERQSTSIPPTLIEPSNLAEWPVPGDEEILICPVGGLGRIGMNWTLYGYAGRWLLVDAGLAFPKVRGGDVDAIIPDATALLPMLDRLDGLVVTHAHEDHIGAIDRLWPGVIDCPIYATPFATAMIARRLDEAGTLDGATLRTFQVGDHLEVGPFAIRTIAMTHSIPEPVALAITTPLGTILHTGDFKFDPDPISPHRADLDALREIGDNGVLAMVADSTNADRDLEISSERQVRHAFEAIFARSRGIVVVCCFASNLARIASAAAAAHDTGRKVALGGRSMRATEALASELGMLDEVPEFLPETRHLQGLDRCEVALICTGTQGEERSALARLSRGDLNLPKVGYGDTVVMSARIVPGNEEDVERVLSKLRARGVKVIEAHEIVDGHPVHVSGHAGRYELRGLHALVRPRFFVPVHGDHSKLAAHAALAIEGGAETATVTSEGAILAVSAQGMRMVGLMSIPTMDLENDKHGSRLIVSPLDLKRPETALEDQEEPRTAMAMV